MWACRWPSHSPRNITFWGFDIDQQRILELSLGTDRTQEANIDDLQQVLEAFLPMRA
jgi:hypothetical protein